MGPALRWHGPPNGPDGKHFSLILEIDSITLMPSPDHTHVHEDRLSRSVELKQNTVDTTE